MKATVIYDPREKNFYSLVEFADILGLTVRALRDHIDRNPDTYPVPYKFGSASSPWRFKKTEVCRWIETNRAK